MPAPIARTLPVMAKGDWGTTNTVSPLFVANATANREESMGGFRNAVLACGVGVVLALPGPVPALESGPTLTLDVARKIVDGCLTKAQQQGWKMHIAVLDIGGNLKAFV